MLSRLESAISELNDDAHSAPKESVNLSRRSDIRMGLKREYFQQGARLVREIVRV